LAGRVVKADTRLRLTMSIVNSATKQHVWGDGFDGESDDPLELQDRIVASVVRVVLPRIRSAEIERAQRSHPRSLDAHGLAMRSLPFVFASRPEATHRALEILHRAMEIDPDYGLTTALAAWGHSQLVMYNGTLAPIEERSQAFRLVRRAAILDDDDSLVLTARCAVHTMAREFDIAEALVTRSLALDPSSGWSWGRSGWLHAYRGNSAIAIDHFGRALSLDPNSASRANNFIGIGSAHFNAKRYDAAAFWLRNALLEQPGTWWANRSLSVSYARVGERSKALESLEALRRACPDLTVGQVVTAVPFKPDFLDRLGEGLSDLGLPP
jgi:adenylate cyclase